MSRSELAYPVFVVVMTAIVLILRPGENQSSRSRVGLTFKETPPVVYAGGKVFCVERGTHNSKNVQLVLVSDRAECDSSR